MEQVLGKKIHIISDEEKNYDVLHNINLHNNDIIITSSKMVGFMPVSVKTALIPRISRNKLNF
jgi:hypothetical protein